MTLRARVANGDVVVGAMTAAVATAPATVDQVVAGEDEQPGSGVGIAGFSAGAGTLMRVGHQRVAGRLKGHVVMVGPAGTPGLPCQPC